MPLAAWLLALLFKMPSPDRRRDGTGRQRSSTAPLARNDLSGEGETSLSVTISSVSAGRRGRHTTHAPVRRCPYSRVDVMMGIAAEHSTDCGHSITLGLVISPCCFRA